MPDVSDVHVHTIARARVAAASGALLLDRYRRGWAMRIIRPIHVASTIDCPVAQAYGGWQIGFHTLNRRSGGAMEHLDKLGFCVGADIDEVALDVAWEIEVADRRRRPLARLVASIRWGRRAA
jgi:hypothetical protein